LSRLLPIFPTKSKIGLKYRLKPPIDNVERNLVTKKGDAVMRIDAYNQIAQAYGVQSTHGIQKTQSVSGPRDQVSISQTGRDYQVAKNAVSEASDIREDKVSQLKSRISAGTYSVDVGDFASKLLEKYQASLV
jgi:negative regulator of flagellin synthesis FlgM